MSGRIVVAGTIERIPRTAARRAKTIARQLGVCPGTLRNAQKLAAAGKLARSVPHGFNKRGRQRNRWRIAPFAVIGCAVRASGTPTALSKDPFSHAAAQEYRAIER
jgi:hypothetical protein